MSLARLSRGPAWWPAVLLFALLYWTLDLAVLHAGVPHPLDDDWEGAIVARHLVAGQGFRTDMIYPPLWTSRDPQSLTLPMVVHGPVVPLLMSLPLATLGPRSLDGSRWWAALLAWLTLIPLYRLAARHFGAPIAAGAALLFTLAPFTLGGVHHSLSVVLGALLVSWALERIADEPPHLLAAGCIAGLAYLVRPEMLLGSAAMAAFALDSARWRGLVRFAAGFALPVLPWWIHQAWVTGSPWFNLSTFTLLGLWGDRPGFSILRDFDMTPARFPTALRAAMPGLWHKWVEFFPHAAWHALRATSGGTGWLALVGLTAALVALRATAARERLAQWLGAPAEGGPSARATRQFVLLAFLLSLIPVVTSTLVDYVVLYFVTFLPIYAIGAAVGSRFVAGRLRAPQLWPLLLAALLLPSVVRTLRVATAEARALELRLRSERAALRSLDGTRGPRLMFSDTPDFVAWTTGRPTVWLTREEFERLYPGADSTAVRPTLPTRAEVGTWFHDRPELPGSIGFQLTQPGR
jgi:hypothetical protein